MAERNFKQKKISPFVTKLLSILNDNDSKGSIEWISTQSFGIVDPQVFSRTILPKYYKHHNLSSFVRQLNIYGFTKLKNSQFEHTYSNPNFVKNSRKSLRKIQRRSFTKEENQKMINISNQLEDSNMDMIKKLATLKNQNQEYKFKNRMIQEQINDLGRQQKEEIQNFVDNLSYLIANDFLLYQSQVPLSDRSTFLYSSISQALEHLQKLKEEQIIKEQTEIDKIIIRLKQKRDQLDINSTVNGSGRQQTQVIFELGSENNKCSDNFGQNEMDSFSDDELAEFDQKRYQNLIGNMF